MTNVTPVIGSTELLALGGVMLGAVAQSATGMGFSLLAAPALIAWRGAHQGVGLTVTLAVLSSLVPLLRDGRHTQPREVARLLVPTLLCTPLIALALRGVDERRLSTAAGTGVIIAVGMLACGVRWGWLRRPLGAVVAGASSALLNVVGGVGRPPIGLYAAHADWSPRTTRGNLYAFFVLQNAVTALAVEVVAPGLPELGALAAGTAAGMLLAPRLPSKAARSAVLAVSLLGGVGLIGGMV